MRTTMKITGCVSLVWESFIKDHPKNVDGFGLGSVEKFLLASKNIRHYKILDNDTAIVFYYGNAIIFHSSPSQNVDWFELAIFPQFWGAEWNHAFILAFSCMDICQSEPQ